MPELAFGHTTSIPGHQLSLPVANWGIEHNQIAGAGTNTLPNAIALFLPITGSQKTHGAMAVRISEVERLLDPDQRRLLEACANQLALALERDLLAIDAAEARIQVETEQIRSSLLSSVSHDLRTPLAVISGASSSLLEAATIDETTRRQLLETVSDEAVRLNRLLDNILQMSKLDAGAATPNKQWHVLEEIVGSALHRMSRVLGDHPVEIHLPNSLPLVYVDGLLLEQMFVNLLENAARHTPAGTQISISAWFDESNISIAVRDDGPGLPSDSLDRIFEKFYRATTTADSSRGSGLGLAICDAIVRSHGGSIRAANRTGGGAEFFISLPVPEDRPSVRVE